MKAPLWNSMITGSLNLKPYYWGSLQGPLAQSRNTSGHQKQDRLKAMLKLGKLRTQQRGERERQRVAYLAPRDPGKSSAASTKKGLNQQAVCSIRSLQHGADTHPTLTIQSHPKLDLQQDHTNFREILAFQQSTMVSYNTPTPVGSKRRAQNLKLQTYF